MPHDAVALAPGGDPAADFGNLACELHARCQGVAGTLVPGLRDLAAVEPRCANAHEHLTRAHVRPGDVLHFNAPAVGMWNDSDCLHVCLRVWVGCRRHEERALARISSSSERARCAASLPPGWAPRT